MAESLGEHTFARQLAPLRAEPCRSDAEQVTQALAGEPLRVLEESGEWVRVETAYAYPGWARREDLGGEPDPDWLRPVAADPVEHARTLLGTRYEWGGMTSAGIDCSGLVHMAFRACGRLVPRDADQQEEAGERLSESELRRGDLVTYGPPEGADHIAFWVGGGRILHATGRDGVDCVVEEEEPAELRATPPRVRAPRALDFAAHVEPTAFPGRAGAVAAALPLLALVFVAGCGGSGRAATSTTVVHRATTAATTTASSTTTSRGEPAHEFPEFRIAMDEATDYLDPGLSDTTEGWGVMWNVYLPLLGYRHVSGPAGAQLVPYLATSLPRISRDGRTYRLTLRDGLKYSNGADVKASDFKATIERDFKLDSAGAAFFLNIRGAKAFAKAPTKRGIKGIQVDDATGTIVIHLKQPQADFSNVLASEFAAPVPADAPATDTSLDPLPVDRAVRDHELSAQVADRRGAQPELPGVALPRRCARGQSRPRHLGHRPGRVGRAPPRPERQGRLDELLPGPEQAPARDRAEAREPAARLHAAEPHVLLHEHARAAVHQPQGAAGGELRDLAAVAQAPRRRPRRHDRERPPAGLPRLPRAHASIGTTCARRSGSCTSPATGTGGGRSSSGTTTSPTDLPFTEYLVAVLKQLGFRAAPKVVTAGSYWTTIGNGKTRAQIGFADFIQDYPHPLDWFRLLDGQTITPTHNSNYANFDVGSVNREIAGADAADEADAERQQRLGRPRPQGDAARAVGAVPQPGGDRLLQRARRPRLLREQRALRVRLREHLRPQEVTAGANPFEVGRTAKAAWLTRRYTSRGCC